MTKMLKRRIYIFSVCQVLLLTSMLSGALADEWRQQASQKLRQWLQSHVVIDAQSCSDQRIELRAALSRFYEFRQHELAWVDRYGLLPEGEMALNAIRHAAEQGLLPSDYNSPWLNDLLNGLVTMPVVNGVAFNQKHIQLDLVITEMMLRYAYQLTVGRTDPIMPVYGDITGPRTSRDLARELATMLARGRLPFFLDQVGPRHAGYRALQQSLRRYQRILAAGGWPVVHDGPTLKRGDRDLRVALTRYRLAVTGDINLGPGLIDDHFDEDLEAAVERFQRRHGLKVDGIIGAKTLAAMNVPVDQRIQQIQLNLERWRWMPENLGGLYVLVNIPGFQLKIIEAGQMVKTMRTIVGRQRRPTPVLSSLMTYLEINPYWNVPAKIARKDLLPKIQEDPLFLVRQDFRVFDSWDEDAPELNPYTIDWASYSEDYFPFRLRQEPATHNALGRVKFMFPNELSVYIHDTPGKSLFKNPSRDFSSGCVRVENPLELAGFLLGRQNWNQERLARAVASNQRRVVVLKEPVPVYLVYFTAWAEEDGEVHFREDIYGHDRQLLSALAEGKAKGQCSSVMFYPTYFVQSDQNRHPDQPAAGSEAPL